MKYVRYTIKVDFVTCYDDPMFPGENIPLPATRKELVDHISEEGRLGNFIITNAEDELGNAVLIPEE